MKTIKIAAALFAVLSAAALSGTVSASARGGAPNIMDSPGYQRALKESRERYGAQSYGQPYIKKPAVYPGRKWRHRGTRYR